MYRSPFMIYELTTRIGAIIALPEPISTIRPGPNTACPLLCESNRASHPNRRIEFINRVCETASMRRTHCVYKFLNWWRPVEHASQREPASWSKVTIGGREI